MDSFRTIILRKNFQTLQVLGSRHRVSEAWCGTACTKNPFQESRMMTVVERRV
jgi:hypothetical protein